LPGTVVSMMMMASRLTIAKQGGSPQSCTKSKPTLSRYHSADFFKSSTRRYGATPRILRFMAGFSNVDALGELVIKPDHPVRILQRSGLALAGAGCGRKRTFPHRPAGRERATAASTSSGDSGAIARFGR